MIRRDFNEERLGWRGGGGISESEVGRDSEGGERRMAVGETGNG